MGAGTLRGLQEGLWGALRCGRLGFFLQVTFPHKSERNHDSVIAPVYLWPTSHTDTRVYTHVTDEAQRDRVVYFQCDACHGRARPEPRSLAPRGLPCPVFHAEPV